MIETSRVAHTTFRSVRNIIIYRDWIQVEAKDSNEERLTYTISVEETQALEALKRDLLKAAV